MTTSPPQIRTLAELRASGHQLKPLREELRDNLLAALREGRDPWPGLHGFASTVIPQLERAVLAGLVRHPVTGAGLEDRVVPAAAALPRCIVEDGDLLGFGMMETQLGAPREPLHQRVVDKQFPPRAEVDRCGGPGGAQ